MAGSVAITLEQARAGPCRERAWAYAQALPASTANARTKGFLQARAGPCRERAWAYAQALPASSANARTKGVRANRDENAASALERTKTCQ